MIGTIELSTGLQVSGKFTRTILNDDNEVIYFQTVGPTALAYREKELIGHGIGNHYQGFSSPLGNQKGINLAIEDMGPVDLEAYNFRDKKLLSFEFESGFKVVGMNVTGIRNIQGKLMIIQLVDCTVTYKDEILFKPEYGIYDLVVGNEVVSVFAGTADHNSFPNLFEASQTLTVKPEKTDSDLRLESHYKSVRELREGKINNEEKLLEINKELIDQYPNEWLLPVEIFEITNDVILRIKIEESLNVLATEQPKLKSLIVEGLEMANRQ